MPIKAHFKPLARIEIMVRDAGDTPTLAMWEFVLGEDEHCHHDLLCRSSDDAGTNDARIYARIVPPIILDAPL